MTEITPDEVQESVDLHNKMNELIEEAMDGGVLPSAAIAAVVGCLWVNLPLMYRTNEEAIELVYNHLKSLHKKQNEMEAND